MSPSRPVVYHHNPEPPEVPKRRAIYPCAEDICRIDRYSRSGSSDGDIVCWEGSTGVWLLETAWPGGKMWSHCVSKHLVTLRTAGGPPGKRTEIAIFDIWPMMIKHKVYEFDQCDLPDCFQEPA